MLVPFSVAIFFIFFLIALCIYQYKSHFKLMDDIETDMRQKDIAVPEFVLVNKARSFVLLLAMIIFTTAFIAYTLITLHYVRS